MADETAPAPSHPLAYVRRSHGWSYQDLARVVAENARALGVPMAARREKVWRWEHWGVVPERDSQRALARALGVPLRDVDARPWPGWLPALAGLPEGLGWDRAGALGALEVLLDSGGRDPRGCPVVEGPEFRVAIGEWQRAALADADAVPRPIASGDDFDVETTAWLEWGLHGLCRLDGRLGGGAVRHRVEADLRIALELIRQGPFAAADDVRLLRTAAALARLGGRAAVDTGRHGAAQRYFLTGLRLAHAAGDGPQAARLWAELSLQAVLDGRHTDALAGVAAAEHTLPALPPAVRATLAMCRARAHAGLGAEAAARRALEEAAGLLDPARDDAEAELLAHSGLVLLDLGHPGEAARTLDKALPLLPPSHRRDLALHTAHAALARALSGDLDGARPLAARAARLARTCLSPRATETAARALAATAAPGQPAVEGGLDPGDGVDYGPAP
ncbi:hypothetical protein ACFYXS_16965 [Streptomyces sp. NPDC002574]|uniref:hypothetical protein n=1 Tax=Streptomyces sp. NPDC002574 TaxID=3364652 RepID=UPI0036932AA5